MPSAGTADTAATAANATTLNGQGAAAFQRTAAESLRVVGAPGQPDFGSGWQSQGGPADDPAAFYKDRGEVYLQGAAGRLSGSDDFIFSLPPGYRPALDLYFITYGGSGTNAWVFVGADGAVRLLSAAEEEYIGLTNISFRAAG